MMDQNDISRFDQGASFIGDDLPAMWRRLWERMLEVGFSEEQAMVLLQTYIFGTAGGKWGKWA